MSSPVGRGARGHLQSSFHESRRKSFTHPICEPIYRNRRSTSLIPKIWRGKDRQETPYLWRSASPLEKGWRTGEINNTREKRYQSQLATPRAILPEGRYEFNNQKRYKDCAKKWEVRKGVRPEVGDLKKEEERPPDKGD